VVSGRVGLDISMVPVEYYKLDTITRDIRKMRDRDAKGFSFGDIYIGTYIQILKDHEKYPDVLMTINLKTASGTNLSAARFIDAPGYFFDLSCGKDIKFDHPFFKSLKPYTMLGFYVWQFAIDGRHQNDAFLFGLGLDLQIADFILTNSYGGYVGYIGNGDKPVVYRFTFKSNYDSKFNYKFRFQQGIHDFNYSTFSVGCTLDLE